MAHYDMEKLIDRINTEPSVLFLGQNYLSSLSGKNPFFELIRDNFLKDKSKQIENYQDMWELVNNGKPLNDTIFRETFNLIKSHISSQMWLRKILNMKWGMIYTSAIDSCLVNCVGTDFTFNPVRKDSRIFKREYLNKRELHGIQLYGSVDNSEDYPPYTCDRHTLNRLKRESIAGKIDWIYKEVLSNYGLLIIDGWKPEADWLDYLLDPADRMPLPEDSIFLFGVDPGEAQNSTITELADEGILTVYPQTFAQALQEIGFFEEEKEDYWGNATSVFNSGKTITIRRKDGSYSFISIPVEAVDKLDEQITLLDDDVGARVPTIDADMRSEYFARYLQQSGIPNWPLCGEKAGFHFEREIDSDLLKRIDTQINEKSSKRNVIIVDGFSNSGKSSSLTYLALRLKSAHKYPVFYVSGKPTQTQKDFEEKLKDFIKLHFLNSEAAIDNIVVIWDGNRDYVSLQDYKRLARVLSECNVLVIGTLYRTDGDYGTNEKQLNRGVTYIHLEAKLSEREEKNLQELLEGIDGSLLERYSSIRSYSNEKNMFGILYRICMYRYSQEWISVRDTLKNRFYREVDYAEDQSKEGLLDFSRKQEEEEVHEKIVQLGIGAAWQLQLIEYKKRLKASENEEINVTSEIDERLPKLEKAEKDIKKINELLALAGQFGVKLPVTLLLRIINHEGALLNQESAFLTDVMQKDSLIEYKIDNKGYSYVRFRQADEAQQYIIKNFGHEEKESKEKEVDLLCTLIEHCRWDTEEAYDLISLIRCFGTNSTGKIGSNTEWGKHSAYIDFLPKIADRLMEYAGSNPAAILVYAHFLRDKYDYDCKRGLDVNRDYLVNAQEVLRNAIQSPASDQQYNRLVIEICSNLNVSMHWSRERFKEPFDRDVFRRFKRFFKDAIATWKEDSHFTKNKLLDIWLNGVINFRESFTSDEMAIEDKEFSQAAAESLYYIGQLYNVSEESDSSKLMSKIDDVFRWVSSDKMDEISNKLESIKNDSYLYMRAWRCWISDVQDEESNRPIKKLGRNLYSLPDDIDSWQEISGSITELRQEARKAAKAAIEILEKGFDLIEESKSIRCMDMLIKSKWICYTGHMPLEEKQLPILTIEQWQELNTLCAKDIDYCNGKEVNPMPSVLFIRAIYQWVYGNNIREAKDLFRKTDSLLRPGRWFIERIGLCRTGSSEQREFYVDIVRTSEGFAARISKELGDDPYSRPIGNERINLPKNKNVVAYLLGTQEAYAKKGITKPVVIWFNAAGPTLGIPSSRKVGG